MDFKPNRGTDMESKVTHLTAKVRSYYQAKKAQQQRGGKIKYIRPALANLARGPASNGPTYDGGPEAA